MLLPGLGDIYLESRSLNTKRCVKRGYLPSMGTVVERVVDELATSSSSNL
jgi:hypothetical protein